jgi:N6-L-threonylcarbamoyladenine synthase
MVVRGHGDMEMVGSTRDDAAGEAFDKAARGIGLGYPGGPLIDRLARQGTPGRVRLPRAYLQEGSFDFSFSGLKTAVVLAMEKSEGAGWSVEDLAAEFQQAVADVLVDKTVLLARERGIRTVALAGGVAANSALRRRLLEAAADSGLEVLIPPPGLCTDNAAMIAAAGYYRLVAGERSGLELNAVADLPVAPVRTGDVEAAISTGND